MGHVERRNQAGVSCLQDCLVRMGSAYSYPTSKYFFSGIPKKYLVSFDMTVSSVMAILPSLLPLPCWKWWHQYAHRLSCQLYPLSLSPVTRWLYPPAHIWIHLNHFIATHYHPHPAPTFIIQQSTHLPKKYPSRPHENYH